jgi:hypothetical protein
VSSGVEALGWAVLQEIIRGAQARQVEAPEKLGLKGEARLWEKRVDAAGLLHGAALVAANRPPKLCPECGKPWPCPTFSALGFVFL